MTLLLLSANRWFMLIGYAYRVYGITKLCSWITRKSPLIPNVHTKQNCPRNVQVLFSFAQTFILEVNNLESIFKLTELSNNYLAKFHLSLLPICIALSLSSRNQITSYNNDQTLFSLVCSNKRIPLLYVQQFASFPSYLLFWKLKFSPLPSRSRNESIGLRQL